MFSQSSYSSILRLSGWIEPFPLLFLAFNISSWAGLFPSRFHSLTLEGAAWQIPNLRIQGGAFATARRTSTGNRQASALLRLLETPELMRLLLQSGR